MLRFLRSRVKWIMGFIALVFVASVYWGYGVYSRRSSGAPERPASEGDRPVVRVDGAVLTLSLLESATREYLAGLGLGESVDEEQLKRARFEVMNNIVERYLLEREAASSRIEVSEEEIQQALKGMENYFPTREDFMKFLERRNVSMEQLKKEISRQIAFNKFMKSLVGDVVVSPDEVSSLYESMKDVFFRRSAGFLVEYAAFSDDKSASRAKEMLQSGSSWEEVLEALSADVVESSSGQTTQLPLSNLSEGSRTALDRAKDGELVGPLKESVDEQVYHVVFRKVGFQKEGYASLDEVRDQVEAILRGQRERERISEYVKSLKERSRIEILDPSLFPPQGDSGKASNEAKSGDR